MTSLRELAEEAASCTRCELYRRATATVFGEGRSQARLVLVGEQPGDAEDKQGHPFVGPAGKLLDRALQDSGIRREDAYVTNAVKHFKWEPRGKRRIHQRPNGSEIKACRHWLEAELEVIDPRVVVALGATAGVSLFGSHFRVGERRGHVEEADVGPWTGLVVSTIHPSAVLRAPDQQTRESAYAGFVADLSMAGKAAARSA
ncbi:MAG TPA: UdgX family uracil-DNA binding protein [Streptosporangiaceae bacterium]